MADTPKYVTVDNLTAAFGAYNEAMNFKRYGVKFPSGGSNVGTRLWDAVGFKSTPTFGSTAGSSDFDNVDPYKHKRCNILDGVVVAYEAYPTFDEYGSNGDVYEEFPNPWLYKDDDELVYGVSMYRWSDDWFRACEYPDGTQPEKIYIPAYKMSVDSDGKGRSIAGVFPTWGNFSTHMTAAQKTSTDAHTAPSWFYTWAQIMLTVEYASRDCQNGSGMQGFSGGYYGNTYTVSADTSESTTVALSGGASTFVVGQTVLFCTSSEQWSTTNRGQAKITAIDTSTNTLTLDTALSLTAGWIVVNTDWKCGSTLDVTGDTGQAVKSSKYSMKWRGIEDLWGGSAEDICDLRVVFESESGSTKSRMFKWCPDPRLSGYADAGNDNYIETGILMPENEGWAKSFKSPDGHPQVQLVTEVGGSSTTYYADYHWHSTGNGNYAVRSGFIWFNVSYLGVSNRYCYYAASHSTRIFCARLFYTR